MKILIHRYLHIFSLFGRHIISRGGGGLNFVKTKDRNFEFFSACSHFLSLTFIILSVKLTDTCRNQEKNHQNCLMSLQFEMIYGNYLEGTCTAFVLLKY